LVFSLLGGSKDDVVECGRIYFNHSWSKYDDKRNDDNDDGNQCNIVEASEQHSFIDDGELYEDVSFDGNDDDSGCDVDGHLSEEIDWRDEITKPNNFIESQDEEEKEISSLSKYTTADIPQKKNINTVVNESSGSNPFTDVPLNDTSNEIPLNQSKILLIENITNNYLAFDKAEVSRRHQHKHKNTLLKRRYRKVKSPYMKDLNTTGDSPNKGRKTPSKSGKEILNILKPEIS